MNENVYIEIQMKKQDINNLRYGIIAYNLIYFFNKTIKEENEFVEMEVNTRTNNKNNSNSYDFVNNNKRDVNDSEDIIPIKENQNNLLEPLQDSLQSEESKNTNDKNKSKHQKLSPELSKQVDEFFEEVDILVEYYNEYKANFKETHLEAQFEELHTDRSILKKRAKLSNENFRMMHNNIVQLFQKFMELAKKYASVSYFKNLSYNKFNRIHLRKIYI